MAYTDEHQIATEVYKHFSSKLKDGVIPIALRAPTLVGTVQDDPFDNYVLDELVSAYPSLDISGSGKLTTPDLILRDQQTGVIVGIEVKKLIQKPNGADPRGLTLDYNSCLPCGTTLIKVGRETVDIPCYYLFCLLSTDSKNIVTLILMHGDFLNYDFNLHKEAKLANQSEYGHGPYGEGSVRNRAMYTYPNPLNHKLETFFKRTTFVTKKQAAARLNMAAVTTHEIIRADKYENEFVYSVIDLKNQTKKKAVTVTDIFSACKARKPKLRTTSSMPTIPEIN